MSHNYTNDRVKKNLCKNLYVSVFKGNDSTFYFDVVQGEKEISRCYCFIK